MKLLYNRVDLLINHAMQVLQGIMGMIAGFLILIYRVQIKDFIGDVSFAEKYLGSGGTWTFLLLVGVATFILSLMWGLGTLQSFMQNTLGPLF